jgi:hypothetical protein
MERTIGGIPLLGWLIAIGIGIGGLAWIKKHGAAAPSTPGGTPQFSQTQEVSDFQIFSSLTAAQQASDLNFLTEVASLFSGGSSTGATTGGGSVSGSTGGSGGGTATTTPPPVTTSPVTSPPATGVAPPATMPVAAPTPAAPATPGFGTINLPGIGQSIILGQIGGSPGYSVGGGAPVYFGNANAVAQGPQAATPGSYAYVPASYGDLVSSSPDMSYTATG